MGSKNKLILNILISKALLQHFYDPAFYSDLVKVMHKCIRFCTRGLYKAKNIQTMPKKPSLIKQALKKDEGLQWVSGYCRVWWEG